MLLGFKTALKLNNYQRINKNRAVLLEFSDFQCPFCAQAHKMVQEFVARHPEQVTVVCSIHPQALEAAQAAYAAQQQNQSRSHPR